MSRRGIGRFGGKGLDRGRATHGAKWCFVTLEDEMLNYAQLREGHENDPPWTKHLKIMRALGWELFKSQKEAKKFLALRLQQRGGLIRNLQRQVKQALNVRRPDGLDVTIGHYVADFTYDERVPAENHATIEWRFVVEETKGYAEDLYLWKRKHFEAQYGIALKQT